MPVEPYTVEKSRALLNRSDEIMVRGCQGHKRSRDMLAMGYPVFTQRASGAQFWDVDGNEYADYIIGQGALLIFDDIITGFKLCSSGAQGWSGVRPDLCVFGKAIGGGVPFAALGGLKVYMYQIAAGKLIHAGTLNANPLCLAAALAALKIYWRDREEHPLRLRRLGSLLKNGLAALAKKHGLPLLVNGPGVAIHTMFTTEAAPENYRVYVLRCDRETWAILRRKFLDTGVRVIERGLWFVSLAHTESDIDETLKRADRAMGESL